MNSKLNLALSEFYKGRWAAVPSGEPPVHPSELNLVTKVLSWLGKLAPLVFARYLITFFIGVAATLAWQSYRDATREEMITATPASLDLVRQSVAKLAVEITKLEAAERNILDKISMPSPRPTATPVRRPVSLTPSAR